MSATHKILYLNLLHSRMKLTIQVLKLEPVQLCSVTVLYLT